MASTRGIGLLPTVMAALAAVAFLVSGGCGGGGDEKPKKDDKKGGTAKGDKKPEKKAETKGGGKATKPNDDPNIEKKELIKDGFKGVLEEYMAGNSKLSQLATALEEADKALAALPRTSWNEEFDLSPTGLNNARVEVASKKLLDEARAWALGNLEQVEEGKKKLQAIADQLKGIPREKLVKNKFVDFQAEYDKVLKGVPEAIKKLENLSELVKRTPPTAETNLLELESSLWTADEGLSWSLANGALQVEGKKGYAQITAMHYYLKDMRLRMTFEIREGGFDIHLRSLPKTGSSLQMGINKTDFAEVTTLFFIVTGNHMRIENNEGNVLDEFDAGNAPTGGGISFLLKEGSSILVTELVLETEKK